MKEETCTKRFEAVVAAIEHTIKQSEKEPILVAIDGMCASGKTTLGYFLKSLFECNLFHMDDFFLQDYQRTKERLTQVGGNVDYERFQKEVLVPMKEKSTVIYRPYSCKFRRFGKGQEITYKRLNIVEGSYSQHPYFKDPYDIKVFSTVSKEKQIDIIKKRNGEVLVKRFAEEWIPKEEDYFAVYGIKQGCILL